MWKLYLKKKIAEVTLWIGIAVILSVIFLPPAVTIFLGLFLVFTPDKKLNEIVESWAKKVKEQI